MKTIFGKSRNFDLKQAEKSRTIPFIFSTGNRDRHQTKLNMNNWKLDNFLENPIIGYMHNVYGAGCFSEPNPDFVIGKAVDVKVSGGQLIGAIEFEDGSNNPLAEKIFRKVLKGFLNSVSVGFTEIGKGYYGEGREAPGGEEPTYYFAGQELLEVSLVNIPSNPEALSRNVIQQGSEILQRVQEMTKFRYSISELEAMPAGQIIKLLGGKTQKDLQRQRKIQYLKLKMRQYES